jgi:hypothetical protein
MTDMSKWWLSMAVELRRHHLMVGAVETSWGSAINVIVVIVIVASDEIRGSLVFVWPAVLQAMRQISIHPVWL